MESSKEPEANGSDHGETWPGYNGGQHGNHTENSTFDQPHPAGSEETPFPERGSDDIPATESVHDRFNRFRNIPPI
jgi:hypothetical protein